MGSRKHLQALPCQTKFLRKQGHQIWNGVRSHQAKQLQLQEWGCCEEGAESTSTDSVALGIKKSRGPGSNKQIQFLPECLMARAWKPLILPACHRNGWHSHRRKFLHGYRKDIHRENKYGPGNSTVEIWEPRKVPLANEKYCHWIDKTVTSFTEESEPSWLLVSSSDTTTPRQIVRSSQK